MSIAYEIDLDKYNIRSFSELIAAIVTVQTGRRRGRGGKRGKEKEIVLKRVAFTEKRCYNSKQIRGKEASGNGWTL